MFALRFCSTRASVSGGLRTQTRRHLLSDHLDFGTYIQILTLLFLLIIPIIKLNMLFVWWQIDLRYSNIQEPDLAINVRFVGLQVAQVSTTQSAQHASHFS